MPENNMLCELPGMLLPWYKENRRDLHWRADREPYHIWLSEIMLQQTRVEAVKGYYTRFLQALPTVESLASCDDDRLHKLWEGLGYYTRVRNLKKAAETKTLYIITFSKKQTAVAVKRFADSEKQKEISRLLEKNLGDRYTKITRI